MRSFWARLFKNELREAQRALEECKTFVRVAIHDGHKVEILHVTGFDYKNYRLNYFSLDREGDFSIMMPNPETVEFIDGGRHELLPYNHEFNKKLAKLYTFMDNNREELRGKRIFVGNCVRTNNPIYLTTVGQYHKLRNDEKKHWPAELPFKFIGLNQHAPGEKNYWHFGYHATRGTTTIIPNVSATWEPDPFYRDLQAEREAKLLEEYNEYLKADHFANGDLIQEGSQNPVVFIRYTDPERSGMMVYPDGQITGIRRILKFKLIQRNYRPDLAKEDPVITN